MLALVLAALASLGNAAPAQVAVMAHMAKPGMKVDVTWRDCGFINAFYSPVNHSIVLCTETIEDNPSHAVFQAAHEMGHAIVDQLDLAIDPDIKASERAADELGSMGMIAAGRIEDLRAAAAWYQATASPVPSWDPHPDDEARATELMCLADGAEAGPRGKANGCVAFYRAVKVRWDMAIAAALVTP